MKKVKISFELIAALAATMTAVAAVVVAMVQTDIMREEAEMEREHARLSVAPSLWIFQNTNISADSANYSVELLNKGLGPAIIEKFEVTLNGKVLLRWHEVVETVSDGVFQLKGENRNVTGVSYSSVPPGHIISAESRVVPIRFTDVDPALVALLNNSRTRPVYSACACSVYKECWKTTGMGSRPVPVDSCDVDPKRYFRGS